MVRTTWFFATLLFAIGYVLVVVGPIEILLPFVIRDHGGDPGAHATVLALFGLAGAVGSFIVSSLPLARRYLTVMILMGSGLITPDLHRVHRPRLDDRGRHDHRRRHHAGGQRHLGHADAAPRARGDAGPCGQHGLLRLPGRAAGVLRAGGSRGTCRRQHDGVLHRGSGTAGAGSRRSYRRATGPGRNGSPLG